jgi:hypothetical protein
MCRIRAESSYAAVVHCLEIGVKIKVSILAIPFVKQSNRTPYVPSHTVELVDIRIASRDAGSQHKNEVIAVPLARGDRVHSSSIREAQQRIRSMRLPFGRSHFIFDLER